jgi:hypothetical protein
MPPDHQLLLLRTAESMADTSNLGSVQVVHYPADDEEPVQARAKARAEVEAEAVSVS